jgi:VCBS repeat-containing protein
MKIHLLAACLLLMLCPAIAQFPGKNLNVEQNQNFPDRSWIQQAQNFLTERSFDFKTSDRTDFKFHTSNANQKIGLNFTSSGYKVSPIKFGKDNSSENWFAEFNFLSITRNKEKLLASGEYATIQNNNNLNFRFKDFSIEYINNDKGLRQNFIVNKKLAGNDKLEVRLSLAGNLVPSVNNNELILEDKNGVNRLFYRDLNVWDANHRPLPASMELRNDNTLVIIVNDQSAQYPITIDPINQTPEWTTSAEGILPGLFGQLAVDAAYGYSVAGLGDVNGDGFDDVAVGAPATVDIFPNVSGSIAAVGAVFVYLGSSNGLSTTPSAVLQPTTVVAGALFGYSIAGGDVNGDGKNDILVGAPLDNISISVGGGNTASGKVGKAYIFNGATLTTSTTPFLEIQLSGSGIISNLNISVNALFGFSVAVTEDLNVDGKKDIIIGAPTYAGIKSGLLGPVLDVQSGGAFVYLTKAANNTMTQVKLEPIKQDLLGLGLLTNNINGLLFGYAVDGTGDYNGDGKPDVVATAPAGINAGSISGLLNGKLLQGSAIVYYGTNNSSGVGVNPGAVLTATSGGLLTNLVGSIANVANLFGVSVKGVRGPSCARNGNIIVGAPLGNDIVNVLGLDLKTGTVSVFKKKSSSPSGYVPPDQVIASPRNSNNILQIIQANLLFGYSLDNVCDINCDGYADIIVGEPVSSGVQLLNANVAGGAAYVYYGNAGGAYQTAPAWTLTAYEDAFLGVNATSLIGYSVAGAGRVKGAPYNYCILVGSPSRTLDFGNGLLDLGSTLGTLFSLVAGNNGVGKAYEFDIKTCDHSPIAVNDVINTNEDVPVNGNVAPNDVPSIDCANTWSLEGTNGGAQHGTVTMNTDGSYTYTPAANYNGSDSFTYKLCDCDGDCSTATVTVTINPVDDVPTAVNDVVTTNEDTPATGNVSTNDTPSPDCANTWLLNDANGGALHGTVTMNADGSYTYTPHANYNGGDTFSYQLCDCDGDCSTAAVTVTVIPVDDVPVAVNDAFTTPEDVAINGTVAGNDTPSGDGGNVWSLVSGPAHGTATVNANGTFNYTPTANYNGLDAFTYKVCDADGDCSTATVNITVTPVDDAPVAVNDAFTTPEDVAINGTVAGNDTPSGDGGNVWSLVSGPAHGTATVNANGTFNYTPTANYNGPDAFTYKVCDADGDCSTATVSISVTPVDDVPVAVNDAFTTPEDVAINGTVAGNDTPSGDGGNVWSLVSGPAHGTATVNANGTFNYTPTANYNGPDAFTYKVCDADGDCSTATVNITVTPVDDAPIAVNDVNSTTENTPVNGNVSTNDTPSPDCPTNVWSLVGTNGGALHGTVTMNSNGTYTYTPNAGYSGTDVFTYKLCDCDGDCPTATVTITISSACATDVTPPTINCPSNKTVTVNASCNFVLPDYRGEATTSDNCPGTITISQSPAPGTTISGVGTTTVVLTATDAKGNTATCSFDINRVDLTPPSITCPSNKTVALNASCNFVLPDYRGEAIKSDNCTAAGSISITQLPATGTVVSGAGTTTVILKATDPSGNTSTCSFTITTTDQTAPVITCQSNKTVACNVSLVFDEPSASDNCGQPSVIPVSTTSAPSGTSTVHTRTWKATDGSGNTSTCSQSITQLACGGITGNIYPTSTTCNSYLGGAQPLAQLCYSHRNNKVSNITPGVFFYFTTITAPSASFCVDIVQTKSCASFSFFAIQQGNQITLFNNSCTNAASGTQTSTGQGRVCITNATPGAQYVISVKYDSKSVQGSPFTGSAPVCQYNFESRINGSVVSGSQASISLTPNCSSGTITKQTDTPAAEETRLETQIGLYPNPASKFVNLVYVPSHSGNSTIAMYDISGKLVANIYQGNIEANKPYRRRVDIKHLSSGVYIIRFRVGEFIETKKLVITN